MSRKSKSEEVVADHVNSGRAGVPPPAADGATRERQCSAGGVRDTPKYGTLSGLGV